MKAIPDGRPPIIIAGMHRSGTSLLCRMLDRLGVFLGWRRESNQEARTFLEINKWLLLQAGCAWDRPPRSDDFDEPEARRLCIDFMVHATTSPWMSFYLGRPWRSRSAEPPRFDQAWGWKDPRNTLTLPLSAELYPDATVINLRRHGVDVAHSLLTRRQQRLARLASRFEARRRYFWLRLRKRRFETGVGTMASSFELWERYQSLSEESRSRFRSMIDVRFEDLVASPREGLEGLASDLGLAPGDQALAAACDLVRPDRSEAWRRSSEGTALAGEHADALARWGYDG